MHGNESYHEEIKSNQKVGSNASHSLCSPSQYERTMQVCMVLLGGYSPVLMTEPILLGFGSGIAE